MSETPGDPLKLAFDECVAAVTALFSAVEVRQCGIDIPTQDIRRIAQFAAEKHAFFLALCEIEDDAGGTSETGPLPAELPLSDPPPQESSPAPPVAASPVEPAGAAALARTPLIQQEAYRGYRIEVSTEPIPGGFLGASIITDPGGTPVTRMHATSNLITFDIAAARARAWKEAQMIVDADIEQGDI